jgi:hypothetical protein
MLQNPPHDIYDAWEREAWAFLKNAPEPNAHGSGYCNAWDEIALEQGRKQAAASLVRDAERYRFVISRSRREWPSLWRYVTFRLCYAVGDPIRVYGEKRGLPRLIDLGCDIVWFGFCVRDGETWGGTR